MSPEIVGASPPDWFTWGWWAVWTRNAASVRDLVLSLSGLVGIGLLWWRTRSVHRQANAALQQSEAALQQANTAAQRHESQVEADREQQITESFGRAVDQLGSEKLETRLGAIYTLERIARESARDHWPIMETLTAFIRKRAPWTPERAWLASGEEQVAAEEGRRRAYSSPATDVQAALTVIGRRREEHERPDPTPAGRFPDMYPFDLRRLDLRGTDLRGADLRGANLNRALLARSHLEDANLTKAHLRDALFFDEPLEQRTVADGRLRAHLEGATLICADLSGAIFWCTHLEGADLGSAVTNGASFKGAHLKGANLGGTEITEEHLASTFTDENTKLPRHVKPPPRRSPGGCLAAAERRTPPTRAQAFGEACGWRRGSPSMQRWSCRGLGQPPFGLSGFSPSRQVCPAIQSSSFRSSTRRLVGSSTRPSPGHPDFCRAQSRHVPTSAAV
jgi:hypothetical protein